MYENNSRVNKILCNINKIFSKNKNNKRNNNNIIKTTWLYDSGAGEHITNDKSLLKNFKEKIIELKCANNTYCTFEGYGEYEFEINNRKFKLDRVYYSKDVAKNMFSGVGLAKIGLKAIIEKINDEIILNLLDENYKTIASFQSNKNNELNITVTTKINTINDKNNIMAVQQFDNFDDLIWHRRLGHYYIHDLQNYLNIHNIDKNICSDCKIAKMKRKPHNKPTPKATDILECIHSDIIGPIEESYTGNRFILTIIDEFSRKTWLFLLKRKSEAIKYIINTLTYFKNVYPNKNIKYFKSDYGREYNNEKIINYCQQNGIVKVYSPPYNPENNGLAERYNLTVISCTKTLLYWSGLSENFWDYAVIYANYLFNKSPHSSINNRIPDEIFFNKPVKIKHIRVFGCLTYYKDFSQNKSKFSPNSKKGVFLGFNEESNAYIVMDYNDFKIHKVREIYCMEDTPSNLKLSNKIKSRFLGKRFLDFDFNFTKENENENEIDSIPNNEKMKFLKDKYYTENNVNLNNKHTNKSDINEDNSSSKNISNNVIIQLNDNLSENNNNSTTLNSQKNNFDKNFSDEKISNNKNFQKLNENNEKTKILNEKTLNNNNFSEEKIFNNFNNNLDSYQQTLNNNENNNHNNHSDNNLSSTSKTLNNNNNFNSFNSSYNTSNIWDSSNQNILPISSYNDIDRVLDYNNEKFITPDVNKGRSNIKTLTIKGDQNIPNNITKIKDILAHNRLYIATKKPKIKFKKASINPDSNKIDIAQINKNKNNNFTSHKTIYKRPLPFSSRYFRKYNKRIKIYRRNKLLANINHFIPKTYSQAINCIDKHYWINAINDELNNLYSNNIMTFVKHVPYNKTIISTRWVFTIKTDSEGNIIKFKARLVARGFNQKFGIDYDLTYSPTLNIDCLKLLLAIAAKYKWSVHQLDIKAAYLNADLDHDIYVTIPPGDTNFGKGYWKLNKAYYMD